MFVFQLPRKVLPLFGGRECLVLPQSGIGAHKGHVYLGQRSIERPVRSQIAVSMPNSSVPSAGKLLSNPSGSRTLCAFGPLQSK